MKAAAAIERRAVSVTLRRRSAGAYDLDGRFIDGSETSEPIKAVIQPAGGNQLRDLPEGIRTEANWMIWSRSPIAVDDRIISSSVSYRVVYVWPRAEGGFFRAALGRETR
ncbi:hypothetical protein [Gellertiella hungarica]|uniref:Head-tail adaptor protein n=1 Tax=Gellertiella hungarica TaxID=1572859 RepID=A0A7W6NJN5_9HYPH|nr:hypothetical protein [Gellertiella hungarica]MBB4063684.1 hypothetical protein [Gellertiella hungarica]